MVGEVGVVGEVGMQRYPPLKWVPNSSWAFTSVSSGSRYQELFSGLGCCMYFTLSNSTLPLFLWRGSLLWQKS